MFFLGGHRKYYYGQVKAYNQFEGKVKNFFCFTKESKENLDLNLIQFFYPVKLRVYH